jgi:hypothetical protein
MGVVVVVLVGLLVDLMVMVAVVAFGAAVAVWTQRLRYCVDAAGGGRARNPPTARAPVDSLQNPGVHPSSPVFTQLCDG